jgi:predicted aspartyl protease
MKSFIATIALTGSIAVMAAISTGCGSVGGADVYLENVNIGSISMEGKPVSGLPTQNVNIVLKTGANKVYVSQSGGKTTIKLQPSGAVITSDASGVSFTGVEPDQVELKWEGAKTK